MKFNNTIKDEIKRIIKEKGVSLQFQQIIKLDEAEIIGYEALCRGPSDSPLHSPLVLFEAAHCHGLLLELELMVMKEITSLFSRKGLAGLLFVNATVHTFILLAKKKDRVHSYLKSLDLPSERIVIELTETHPVFDPQVLENAIGPIKDLGFHIALDDLGEGFSSLKRWSVMKPHFVKIDRHFIDGISRDSLKQQFITSILDISRVSGCRVIAEGIEQIADLKMLAEMGIVLGQGFLIARPLADPPLRILTGIKEMLMGRGKIKSLSQRNQADRGEKPQAVVAGDLAHSSPFVTEECDINHVIEIYRNDPDIQAIPVLNREGYVSGIIRSKDFLILASRPFFHEVFSKRSCREVMDREPVVFDEAVDLRTMSETVSRLEDSLLMSGFLVTSRGKYLGLGRMTELIKAISDSQIFAARYANPLTFLPGNVPIDERIASFLEQQEDVIVVYWDLNQFKPYNDVYGYAAGDEVIKATGRIIQDFSDPELDFLGHIGGDDFVSLFRSPDWEDRIKGILNRFENETKKFLRREHIEAGGYVSKNRQGKLICHPVISLAGGVLPVKGGSFSYPGQVSQAVAEVKKQAKKLGGNAYFVDRRGSPANT